MTQGRGADGDLSRILPDEQALAKVRAVIAEHNAERKKVIVELWWRRLWIGCGSAAGVLLCAYAGSFFSGSDAGPLMLLPLAGMVWAWSKIGETVWHRLERTQDVLLPAIFGFVDGFRFRQRGWPDVAAALTRLDLVAFDVADYEDLIDGTVEGVCFSLCEAHLGLQKSSRRSSVVNQFRGLVLKVKLDTPFPGWLVARKKRFGGLLDAIDKGFSAADSKDLIALSANDVRDLWQAQGAILSGRAVLDESHEFVTDNLAAAAGVIDDVARTIAFLSSSFDDDVVRLALDGDSCILMLPSKHDFFELPNIYLEMTEAKIMPMLSDFVTLLEIAKLSARIGVSQPGPAESVAGAQR
ncbi:hypothetical protein IB267_02875 [Ensifer sp. ENS09]|uniref:hypothetical protein n=1 Tax=Ensifer sp. ENS09 TaxID=2769263 RepID=UPI00178428F7|nr:hypothetical protein [Ensifer sp. ENS09]MBD9647291.1 hypothetical protein [Ensifer sp. ENS09]